MTDVIAKPVLTDNGVTFTMVVDGVKRECVVSIKALAKLSSEKKGITDPLQTFHACEAKIKDLTRRMIANDIKGNPLYLGSHIFH